MQKFQCKITRKKNFWRKNYIIDLSMTSYRMACSLCYESRDALIDFQSDEAKQSLIATILYKHFPFCFHVSFGHIFLSHDKVYATKKKLYILNCLLNRRIQNVAMCAGNVGVKWMCFISFSCESKRFRAFATRKNTLNPTSVIQSQVTQTI